MVYILPNMKEASGIW